MVPKETVLEELEYISTWAPQDLFSLFMILFIISVQACQVEQDHRFHEMPEPIAIQFGPIHPYNHLSEKPI